MLDLEVVHDCAKKLKESFLEIQQPRSNFALEHFVKGLHDLPERQYEQIVEELRRCYNMIKMLLLSKEQTTIERDNILASANGARLLEIEAAKKDCALEDIEASLYGKLREFECLYKLWEAMPKYTREDIEKAEPEYWRLRLTRQAGEDITTQLTRVGVGNLDALWQAGLIKAPRIDMATLPEHMNPELAHKG